ncbi:hypothetical protein Halru_2508 [Halovivax ruber XH-70]|uniref:Uncharacterized protein n=1 Tax=Halovivax ruber (strain DSM 18193 / JCM 13892 / XH-70) TaxID=797302 RepID=L0IBZ0_HALRX|nr:hypothetical protein [Halovivax ruber]AGB17090.1 hypothetical protein Halru_2508 [Halovivax ruber XH-70]
MKSVERERGGAGDVARDRECYRCDRDVAPPRLFRVDVEPPEIFSADYAHSVRYCCPDCIAAMGMLEFTERWKEEAGLLE